MFFYLSQSFSFLIMPLTICLVLLTAGIFLGKKKTGRRLLIAGLILLFFFTNSFLANFVMNAWEPPFQEMSTLPEYEIGIVLTGVTNLNKTSVDRTFFNKGADRATHAMQLYKMGKISKILITGGQGFSPVNDNTEAELLADFLVWAGVKPEDIIIENQAQNTRENAAFTKIKLAEEGYAPEETCLLITSAFHIKRAMGCFEKAGINVEAFPVDYYGSDSRLTFKSLFQPDPGALLNWHKLVKEWTGIAVYRTVGYM
ncbi:YdcF family protein [Negadavirga shengliensis]|uniref:YdcF family protein n=1 Tax=Negadavirga shengliensis TaxID=1389218 RepID=A0ABV9T498_9BACT